MEQNSKIDNLPTKLLPFIWRYLKHQKIYLVGFFFIALVWAVDMSLRPYLLKVIIDTVVNTPQNQVNLFGLILLPALLYVAMSVVLNIAMRLHDYINLRLYPSLQSAVSKDMFAYLMHHSQTFFQNHFSGSLTRKIFDMAEVERLVDIFNVSLYPRIFAMIISCITLFMVIRPIFGIILFVWAVLFIFISYLGAVKSESLARDFSEASAKVSGTMSDSVANIMSTKLFANISHEVVHIDHDLERLVDYDRRLRWRNLKFNFILELSVTVLIASMFAALIYGRTQGWVSPGDFALVLMLSISFFWSINSMGREILTFSRGVGACNQALSFIRIPHEITDAPNAIPLIIKKGEIKFQNVNFHYENSNPLFTNLNVTINPGEKVGLVGYSGGGKSTFIKLILRLIDTQSGSVLVDDQDVKKVTNNSLKMQIGAIPQEPDLFHRTIMENIRFAKIDASDEEIIEAAKKARCHEFISELPDKYQSLVGERGIKLSSGQKQRIAIARAFLKNAPILLLDEATSALDSVTERYIQESLHDVLKNKTTIAIAHRLSTLKDMDRILVFVQGKIVEDGSLNELIKDQHSHFYKLWQMQAEGFLPSSPG